MVRADGASASVSERPTPIIYLDLDGTVRHGKDELGRFVNGPDDVVIFDGVPKLLRRYRDAGWRIVACSNQGGIALGHMTMESCAKAMIRTQDLCGGVFHKITWCQHHPAAADPEFAVCWCRKPRIGMVVESALALSEQHRDEFYPPHLGVFVGDRSEDAACAEGAGLRFVDAARWRKQGPESHGGLA